MEILWRIGFKSLSFKQIAYNVYKFHEPDTVPVYRFYSPRYLSHVYTISESEKDKLINNDADWNYEGIEYYAYPR